MLCVTKIYHCTLPEVSFCRPVYLQPRYDVLATKESLLRLWYGLGARRLLYGAVHLGRARRPVHHSGVALPATYLGSGFGCGSCGRALQFPKLHLRPSRPSGARAHAFALQHCLLPRLSMLILALSVDTCEGRRAMQAIFFRDSSSAHPSTGQTPQPDAVYQIKVLRAWRYPPYKFENI